MILQETYGESNSCRADYGEKWSGGVVILDDRLYH